MGKGLATRMVPIFVGGALDTKTDPRLVQPGSLLELENMWMLRTGELRQRNGFTTLPQSGTSDIPATDNLFAAPGGILETIAPGWNNPANVPWKVALRYLADHGGTNGWERAQQSIALTAIPYPNMVAELSGVTASSDQTALGTDFKDGDCCSAGNLDLVTYTDGAAAPTVRYFVRMISGQLVTASGVATTIAATNGRPPVCASGGASFMCAFWCDNAGVPSLQAYVFSTAGVRTGPFTLVLNGVAAAQPWIDAKPIPGGNTIAVAYRATAGGVSTVVFDPSTGGVTVGPVNTAGADASFCLGWLDDQVPTGSMLLATVGNAAGAVVRVCNPATMAVTATNVIDATATANVRQVTGHVRTGVADYVVYWEVDAAPTTLSSFKRGAWTGAAAVSGFAPPFGLYSKTFKNSDGRYCFVASYDSTTQPSYTIFGADSYGFADNSVKAAPLGQVLPSNAGGRRTVQSSLAGSFTSGISAYVALARKQTVATAASAAVRILQLAKLTATTKLARPRELGGTFFLPGGIINSDDGVTMECATIPYGPETPTLLTPANAGGAMTNNGVYSYRLVFKRVDAAGRIGRSPSSPAASVTLGAADNQVTVTAIRPPLRRDRTDIYIAELYRAGPAATGATNYNKVAEVAVVDAALTFTFVDQMSDVNANLGELLYSTGGVLENFVTPSCTLMEVNQNRLGIISAENGAFWPSLEYKPGQGIRFNPLLAIQISGDGYGAPTALAAMDGRWIVFKSAAIYVISGDGPNDNGQGSFNAPQAVSLSIGTTLPGSVVATPDGIMFQSAKGIYLLDRSLGLQYIGAPIEQYTRAASVVDASLVTGVTQARFVFSDGRCLVWDYYHKRWYTFLLAVGGSTVVACADLPSGWCYATADGKVRQEGDGVTTDDGASIVPAISFPNLNLAGITGYERVKGVHLTGEYVGAHTLSATFELDYSGVQSTPQTFVTAPGPYQYTVMPPVQKCSACRVRLTTTGANTAGGFRLSGASLEVGVKRGSGVPYTKRLT